MFPFLKVIQHIPRIMAQSDFSTLAVQHELVDENPKTDEVEYKCSSISEQDAASAFDVKPSMEADVPGDFIPDEVYALIAAWELTDCSLGMTPSDRMDFDADLVPPSPNIFEPVRRLKTFAPPKRFYRTFWRSASRRILALSSTQTT
jgi:hypothetical protein